MPGFVHLLPFVEVVEPMKGLVIEFAVPGLSKNDHAGSVGGAGSCSNNGQFASIYFCRIRLGSTSCAFEEKSDKCQDASCHLSCRRRVLRFVLPVALTFPVSFALSLL